MLNIINILFKSPTIFIVEIIPNACNYKNGYVKERNTPINYNNISVPNLSYININKTIITYEDNCSIIDNVFCDDYDIHSVILHQSHHFTFIKKITHTNKWIYYNDTVVRQLDKKEADDLINKKGSFLSL